MRRMVKSDCCNETFFFVFFKEMVKNRTRIDGVVAENIYCDIHTNMARGLKMGGEGRSTLS